MKPSYGMGSRKIINVQFEDPGFSNFLYPIKSRSSYKTELQMKTCKLSETYATGIWVDLEAHFRFSMLLFSHSVPTCFCNFCTWAQYNNECNSGKRMVYKSIYIYIFPWKKKSQSPAELQSNFLWNESESPSLRWPLDLQEDLEDWGR